MFDNHRDEEGGDIHELMQRYQNLKLGRTNSYIEEDDFERIIEHLDEKDEIGEAIEAANIALNQYPRHWPKAENAKRKYCWCDLCWPYIYSANWRPPISVPY